MAISIYHADHGISPETISAMVATLFPCAPGFFLHTFTLPEGAPDALNALHGPACGDAPVLDSECSMEQRTADRPPSRLCSRPKRPTRLVTIIGETGYNLEDTVIYTAYGGPCAEREPGDPSMMDNPEAQAAAAAFWSEHALSR